MMFSAPLVFALTLTTFLANSPKKMDAVEWILTQRGLDDVLANAEDSDELRALFLSERRPLFSESIAFKLERSASPFAQIELALFSASSIEKQDQYRRPKLKNSSLYAQVYGFPVRQHPKVEKYIKHFSQKGRWFFQKWLARKERYAPIMVPILKEYGIPEDVIHLAMIESGFSARATSTSAAAGFWQFIRSTGKHYRLKQSEYVDQRRDFILATHAAGKYLKRLYKMFGDWHLAFASYNGGEGRVGRALKKHGVKTFWELEAIPGALPDETKDYVPKIIAATLVSKNLERFGYAQVVGHSQLDYEEIKIKGQVDFRVLARDLGLDERELRTYNPQFIRGVVPPHNTQPLRLRQAWLSPVKAWLSDHPARSRTSMLRHRVVKGQTLSGISRKYGSTVSAVMAWNELSAAGHLKIGQELVIPVSQKRAKRLSASGAKRSAVVKTHTIQKGETLWSIAQRYKLTVQRLKSMNNMSKNQIRVGDALRVSNVGS